MTDTETRTVKITVAHDYSGPFGVAEDHRSDLPKPFNQELQRWVKDTFTTTDRGDVIEGAAEMIYEPHGEIIGFNRI